VSIARALAAAGYGRVEVPLVPSPRTGNAYLVEGGVGWGLVDSGMHTDAARTAISRAAEALGIGVGDLAGAFVTHRHPDHVGLVGWLQEMGVPVAMHGPEARAARLAQGTGDRLAADVAGWLRVHGMTASASAEVERWSREAGELVAPFAAVEELADGRAFMLAGRPLRVIWTPGHTDFHAVLYDAAERVLLAGDHVLPHAPPNVGLYPWSRPDPLGDYLVALESVARLDVRLVLPGHGAPFTDLAGRAEAIAVAHRERRARALDGLVAGTLTAGDVVAAIHGASRGARALRFAWADALALLRHLERQGLAVRLPDDPPRWRAGG
jgi:glyoxylase-like metal-dependent hydrolase (beta-lactamase superfamily II)